MGVGQRGPPVRSATGRPQPNQALEPTPSLQRPLRSRFRARLTAGVRRIHLRQEER